MRRAAGGEVMRAPLFQRSADPAEVLIRGGHVLDPRAGIDAPHDLLIRAGHVAEIAPPDSLSTFDADVVDARGKHVFPAFVDPHVHLRTPGHEYKETIATGTASAAAGGFGTVVAMPNTVPSVDHASILRAQTQTAQHDARIPLGFLAAITRAQKGEELTEMAELREAGALGFTDDGWPVVSAGLLRKALQYQRLCGGVLALHEEDPALSAGGAMHEGAVSARLGLAGIPAISESTMISRDAALALYEGGRVHFQHLSCAESVAVVERAKAQGARVSAEVSPHHLTLTDESVRALDSRYKMNPPLRAEADRKSLVQALKTGLIDCIATDHAPHAAHEKEVPFEQAAMGTTGLETAFAALHTRLVLGGELELATLVERMTAGAALFELTVPRIAPDQVADICVVDLQASWEVGARGYVSRSENCCFGGETLRGRVLLTVAAGVVAFRAPALADAPALTAVR
jgi:dihydroorotase